MKSLTMRQLLKPIVYAAKARGYTLARLTSLLKTAWGKPTPKEVEEAIKEEERFQNRVRAGLVRDRI